MVDIPDDCGWVQVDLTFLANRTESPMAAAERIWSHNKTHIEELRAKLQKFRGSLPCTAFDGQGGVDYQRKVRDEWDSK
ncbi:hypothetical protein FACS1894151_08000 [Spirochaetia bacterium]|nr:hypothetical protein FACS1894151_08000 [Spirochaetia bacterium]